MSLQDMQQRVFEINSEKGWIDTRSFGDSIALIHSEVSEALEAYRSRGFDFWVTETGKPEGVGSEFADIFIRLLDCCQRYNIDLEEMFNIKLAYNRTRPFRHGGKAL